MIDTGSRSSELWSRQGMTSIRADRDPVSQPCRRGCTAHRSTVCSNKNPARGHDARRPALNITNVAASVLRWQHLPHRAAMAAPRAVSESAPAGGGPGNQPKELWVQTTTKVQHHSSPAQCQTHMPASVLSTNTRLDKSIAWRPARVNLAVCARACSPPRWKPASKPSSLTATALSWRTIGERLPRFATNSGWRTRRPVGGSP